MSFLKSTFVLVLLLVALGSAQAEKLNVLLICVDDLRPELKSFGKEYIQSPNIDDLVKRGRAFTRHYVQAPTCGASRYTLLTGKYGPYGNGALFARGEKLLKDKDSVSPSMPGWFRQNGYTTVSVGKVSHHPGGRGGKDWDDDSKLEMPESWDRHLLPSGSWKHPRGVMHGLAHGEIRVNPKQMDLFQTREGDDSIYPDGLIVDEALKQMGELSSQRNQKGEPFFLAVGIIRPHLPFGAPAKYLSPYKEAKLPAVPHPEKPKGKTTWHGSGEFMKYNRWGRNPNNDEDFSLLVRKHYAACVTYADALVGRLIAQLKELGEYNRTAIVLWGDHGWHLGEHSIWGKHSLFEESLNSPLIVTYPGIKKPGRKSNGIVETIDIFPTLCDVTGIDVPDFIHGQSLEGMLNDPDLPGHPAISYTNSSTIRTDRFRLITHKDGRVELYDHHSELAEAENLAIELPGVARELNEMLQTRIALRGKK